MTLIEPGENPTITPGIRVEEYPGHTAQMLAIHIESAGQHACYAGDLFPTTHHLDPTWVMGYDLDPITCIAQPSYTIGRESVAALIRKMSPQPDAEVVPSAVLRLKAELRIRKSIAPPASSDASQRIRS